MTLRPVPAIILVVIGFILLPFLSHCQSQDEEYGLLQDIKDSEPKPMTYTLFAQKRLDKARDSLITELTSRKVDFRRLHASILQLRDMIDIFVYAFPVDEEGDVFFTLRGMLERGDRMLSEPNQTLVTGEVEAWRAQMRSPAFQSLFTAALLGFNTEHATLRPKNLMTPRFWNEVDFIPDVKASAAENLKEFANALFSSAHNRAGDSDVENKLQALSDVVRYFPQELSGEVWNKKISEERARLDSEGRAEAKAH